MNDYWLKILEKLDDEDWNMPKILKLVMRPKSSIKNPPSKKMKK